MTIDTFEECHYGGSMARLEIKSINGRDFIRKTATHHANKLKAQYLWLKDQQQHGRFPRPVKYGRLKNAFFYEMEFDRRFIPLFHYIHRQGTGPAWNVLRNVLAFMRNEIHRGGQRVYCERSYGRYVRMKVLDKVEMCVTLVPGLAETLKHDRICVNGEWIRNFRAVYCSLDQNLAVRRLISSFDKTLIHGDLTVENILVQDESNFLVIDPNDENILSTPLIDYAKLMQSLHSGYEFLCQLREVEVDGPFINFDAGKSVEYSQLHTLFEQELKQILDPLDHVALSFHEAVHFARMLPYKARINPDTFMAFYATMMRNFHLFLAQL